MRRLYFVLSLFVLGMAACMSGNQLMKETTPTSPQPLNLLVMTTPRTPTPSSPDCSFEGNTPEAQLIYSVMQGVEPPQAEPGQVVKIIAGGGYTTWGYGCGTSYDESHRSFLWALDGEYQGEIACYVNHCETMFELPEDIPAGAHTIEVEGGSQIMLEVNEP